MRTGGKDTNTSFGILPSHEDRKGRIRVFREGLLIFIYKCMTKTSPSFCTIALVVMLSLTLGTFFMSVTARAEETVPAPSEPQSQEPAPVADTGENGTGGESAETPSIDSGNETENSVIDTGDAVSTSLGEQEVNTNTIDTPPSGDTTVALENEAEAVAETEANSGTGANQAVTLSGGALVLSGDAYASATNIQVVNTNIIDSAGLILFQDLFYGLGIDLRNINLSYFTDEQHALDTDCASCNGGTLAISANNQATATGAVISSAISGENSAISEGGDASVLTGNAYASANGVQIVNSNIIKSNYLLIGINNFGDFLSDITLPNEDFFRDLLINSGNMSGPLSVNATNTAQTTVSADAEALTGGNTAITDSGTAAVFSGDAYAAANSYSQINSTLIGGTEIFFLFRIWGEWNGTIHGLPEGMEWEETPYGIQIRNVYGETSVGGDLASDEECCGQQSLQVALTNDAVANLDVKAYALTGDNRAQSGSADAYVGTGNAYAAANSVQFVNTNLIGRNWIYAIFNIFGNFDGNIAFGHPDLWIGAVAETTSPTKPGAQVLYTFTIANNGDANATNVRIKTNHLQGLMHFADGEEYEEGVTWELGTIKKGTSKEFSYVANAGLIESGTVAVPLAVTVTSRETDENTEDNTDFLTVVIESKNETRSTRSRMKTGVPELTVVKTASVQEIQAPGNVDYVIDIKNEGPNAYDTVLVDTLKAPSGEILHEQIFDVGHVLYGDEIRVTYSVHFDSTAESGTYENVARLTGTRRTTISEYPMAPVEAVHTIEVGRGLCPQYLTSYIEWGGENATDEVKKLQRFLIDAQGEGGVSETGEYDEASYGAVHRFQEEYFDEIIAPWGGKETTGFVYYTTQKKINDLYCNGARTFDLSDEQVGEITTFRQSFVERATVPDGGTGEEEEPLHIGSAEPVIREEEAVIDEEDEIARRPWWGGLLGNFRNTLVAGAGFAGIFNR